MNYCVIVFKLCELVSQCATPGRGIRSISHTLMYLKLMIPMFEVEAD